MLTKDQILKADDKRYVEVDVPEWSGTVRLRTMTGRERDKLEGAISKAQNSGSLMANFRGSVCGLCICDEAGERVFNDLEIRELGDRSGIALDRVFSAAVKLNGIGDAEVKEMVENSDAAPSGEPGSS